MKRNDSCAGYLIFERDLTSFYETGKLINFAVDCRGNDGIRLPHYQVFCVQQDETGSHDEKKNSCRNPQHQAYTVNNATVCTETEADIKMIVHVADAVEMFTSQQRFEISRIFSCSVFPTILEPGKGLFILKGILSVLWDRKYPTHTLCKDLWSI